MRYLFWEKPSIYYTMLDRSPWCSILPHKMHVWYSSQDYCYRNHIYPRFSQTVEKGLHHTPRFSTGSHLGENQGEQIGIALRHIESWQICEINWNKHRQIRLIVFHHGLVVCVSRLSHSRTQKVEQEYTENLKRRPGQTMSTTLVRMHFRPSPHDRLIKPQFVT